MNKNEKQLERRRQFVLDQVKSKPNEKVEYIVKRLSDTLFLSETTIYNDLRKAKDEKG